MEIYLEWFDFYQVSKIALPTKDAFQNKVRKYRGISSGFSCVQNQSEKNLYDVFQHKKTVN